VRFRERHPPPNITATHYMVYRIATYDMTSHILNNNSLPVFELVDHKQAIHGSHWLTIGVGLLLLFGGSMAVYRLNSRSIPGDSNESIELSR